MKSSSFATSPRRVMVGTDRSETAERAVRWAAIFAERSGAELHLVQVIVPEHGSGAGGWTSERFTAATEDLIQHGRSIAGECFGRVIVDNDPAMAIVRAAEEGAVDVLVVGNSGMGGRKEFLLGNVPNRISHNARCTVVIVNTIGADGNLAGSMNEAGTHALAARPHRIARGGKIAAVFAKYGIMELFGVADAEGATGRRRQAKRLRCALQELGPTFAKLGQMLSTRPDLLPPEFVAELARLQDRVTPLTEEEVVRVMEADLRVPWEDVFETIDREPLAAGTIAQVNRASLASGEKVVVKTQRPAAKELIEQDLALLKLFAGHIGTRPAMQRLVDVPALFDHLSASLRRELDFHLEASNAERMRHALTSFPRLAVPRIHKDLSTQHLLVMQDVGGLAISEIRESELRREIARQLVECLCEQILITGFFHADPHPGNLMWQPDEQRLYFLDLGLVGEVDAATRELLALLLLAFWHGDPEFLADVILMLSGSSGAAEESIRAFRRDLHAFVTKYHGVSSQSPQFGPVLYEIIQLSFRHGVALPASLSLIAKTLAQMQSVTSQLDPELDPFDVAARYLTRVFLGRVVPNSDGTTLFYEFRKLKFRAMRTLERLERLSATGDDRVHGKMNGASLEALVQRAVRPLGFGFTAGFALLASAMIATSSGFGWVSATFAVAAAVFAIALIVDLLRNGEQPHTLNQERAGGLQRAVHEESAGATVEENRKYA